MPFIGVAVGVRAHHESQRGGGANRRRSRVFLHRSGALSLSLLGAGLGGCPLADRASLGHKTLGGASLGYKALCAGPGGYGRSALPDGGAHLAGRAALSCGARGLSRLSAARTGGVGAGVGVA